MSIEVWQEFDCPGQQCDADLNDDDMVFIGASFHCTWCGNQHVCGDIEVQTYKRDNNIFTVIPTPQTHEELIALKNNKNAANTKDAPPDSAP
jgi:hypothetical protein